MFQMFVRLVIMADGDLEFCKRRVNVLTLRHAPLRVKPGQALQRLLVMPNGFLVGVTRCGILPGQSRIMELLLRILGLAVVIGQIGVMRLQLGGIDLAHRLSRQRMQVAQARLKLHVIGRITHHRVAEDVVHLVQRRPDHLFLGALHFARQFDIVVQHPRKDKNLEFTPEHGGGLYDSLHLGRQPVKARDEHGIDRGRHGLNVVTDDVP
jgi:hypothetical protein